MRRVLLSAGLGLTLCAGLAVPAAAQRDPGSDVRPVPTTVPTTEAAPVDVRPVDTRPDDRPIEELRLACAGRITDEGRAGVACEWSPTSHRAAAGYTLVRSDGVNRTTVFSTRDLTETIAVDRNIRLGHTYTYAVLVLDANGTTIGQGGPVQAGVRAPDPEIEVLTMTCAAADDAVAAHCNWRSATSESAAGYQLWRIVNRGERELVWRGGLDQTAARDDLPNDTLVVRYAVLAVDVDGEIVGQSRPFTLRFDDGSSERPIDRTAVRSAHVRAHTYR